MFTIHRSCFADDYGAARGVTEKPNLVTWRASPHRNLNAPGCVVTIENSTAPVRQNASECVKPDTDTGAMPQNSDLVFDPVIAPVPDPVLAALDAARERWPSTQDRSAVRLLLLDAIGAMEK